MFKPLASSSLVVKLRRPESAPSFQGRSAGPEIRVIGARCEGGRALCQAEGKGVEVQAASCPACRAASSKPKPFEQTPFPGAQSSQLCEPSLRPHSLVLGGLPEAFGPWLSFSSFPRPCLILGTSSIHRTQRLPPVPLKGTNSNLSLSPSPCPLPRIFCCSWASHSPDALASHFTTSLYLFFHVPEPSGL